MTAPLMIDLFCGLGGWASGGLAEGYRVIGFDIECHEYGEHRYPAELVIQDVLTLHGSQFRDAALIVASPPCQEFSYMAMPWRKAKAKRAALLAGPAEGRVRLTALFDACFRIQREGIEEAGHFIPLVVENVCGAQPWVGRAKWHFGSYYLWGDVPALMPIAGKLKKGKSNFHFHEQTGLPSPSFHGAEHEMSVQRCAAIKNASPGQTVVGQDPVNGIKQGGSGRAWFCGEGTIGRTTSSRSPARKAASAMIAKIPFVLARHIAASWKPKAIALGDMQAHEGRE